MAGSKWQIASSRRQTANGKWQAAGNRQWEANSKWQVAGEYVFSGGQQIAKGRGWARE